MSSPAVLKKPLKLACIQLASGADKAANLKHAADQVAKAASGGSKLVVLPECFNSPYGTDYFPQYAETLLPSPPSEEQAPSYHALSRIASDNKVYLVGGSIPEFNPSTKKYHNTSLIFGPDGRLLATHRKVHLFDIDIPGKISFHESDVLSPGNQITLVDLPDPARDLDASYHAYGHTLVVDPMAQVLDEAEAEEAIIQVELVDEKLAETRRNIALNTQRRFDVYPDVSKGKIQFEDPDLETPK
uniref:CN hydrolase domain-containing protein n=1 Tax=Bionectria ochroleuca TaxID=29856 RepID=A0A0B7K6V6_BIOOC